VLVDGEVLILSILDSNAVGVLGVLLEKLLGSRRLSSGDIGRGSHGSWCCSDQAILGSGRE
jgi:hypothetical protein